MKLFAHWLDQRAGNVPVVKVQNINREQDGDRVRGGLAGRHGGSSYHLFPQRLSRVDSSGESATETNIPASYGLTPITNALRNPICSGYGAGYSRAVTVSAPRSTS